MKPNIVGNANIEAIRTKTDPVRTLLMFAVFIHRTPSTPRAISIPARIANRGNQ